MTGRTGPDWLRAAFTARSMIGDALLPEGRQDVLLRREIIEEGSLADVGGLGDGLDGGFLIAALREELQRGLKKAVASFGAVALAASRGGFGAAPGDGSDGHDMTSNHIRL